MATAVTGTELARGRTLSSAGRQRARRGYERGGTSDATALALARATRTQFRLVYGLAQVAPAASDEFALVRALSRKIAAAPDEVPLEALAGRAALRRRSCRLQR